MAEGYTIATRNGVARQGEILAIAVDGAGNAHLTGFVESLDFPVANAIQASKGAEACSAPPCQDAFLAGLDPSGSLVYSTYLGGGRDDFANGIALDGSGAVYLTGATFSADFPTTPGSYSPTPQTTTLQGTKLDLFIAKISAPLQPGMAGSYTWHYDYDGLSRLVSACSQWDAGASTCLGESFSYSYDGAGNARSFSRWGGSEVETVSFVYNGANQIACRDDGNGICGDAGDTAYSYDAYGNLTGDGMKSYAYDAENRLVSVTDGTSVTTYTYNGDGERMAQTVDGVTTSYVLDTAAPLTMVLAETSGTETIYYLHGLDLIAQSDGVTVEYFGYDGLGSVRQMLDSTGGVLFAQVFDPYGSEYASVGTSSTSFGFTGEQTDSNGLVYLRARYYNPRQGRFLQRDLWRGVPSKPLSQNPWLYGYGNPVEYIDPSGYSSISIDGKTINCPIGGWDCEAVKNVAKLKQAFLGSASRHNKIPTMDNNGFAGLIASTIVSERRIGNVPPDSDPRNRKSQMLEDLIASFGCTVSGNYLKEAMDNRDLRQLLRYLFNQDTPQRATVGIGNVWLETAANLWKGQACSGLGDCTQISISKMQTRNVFGQTVDVSNPFGPQLACAISNCAYYQPDETESYVRMTSQLLSWEINIEYVAANLEAGALRAIAKGEQPTAFNSATWHLRGLQTDEEIEGRWNPGGAIWILDHIPTALTIMDLKSTWNISSEPQYAKYR